MCSYKPMTDSNKMAVEVWMMFDDQYYKIPKSWPRNLKKARKRLIEKSGRRKRETRGNYALAMLVLFELIWWHRPKQYEVIENGKKVKRLGRRFKEEMFRVEFEDWADELACEPRHVQEALALLEALGLIERHIKKEVTQEGKIKTSVYVTLNGQAIKDLTTQDAYRGYKIDDDPDAPRSVDEVM